MLRTLREIRLLRMFNHENVGYYYLCFGDNPFPTIFSFLFPGKSSLSFVWFWRSFVVRCRNHISGDFHPRYLPNYGRQQLQRCLYRYWGCSWQINAECNSKEFFQSMKLYNFSRYCASLLIVMLQSPSSWTSIWVKWSRLASPSFHASWTSSNMCQCSNII